MKLARPAYVAHVETNSPEMREITIRLPDGRISIHQRPTDLPNHLAFVDRSMTAMELHALLNLARNHAELKKVND